MRKQLFKCLGMMLSFSTSLFNLQAAAQDPVWTVKEFPVGDFDSVKMNIDGGDVCASAASADRATVSFLPRSFGQNCTLEMGITERVLKIDCKKVSAGEDCRVDFKLSVPSRTGFKVNSGSSMLSMEGITGFFEANMGYGNINLMSPLSYVKCKLGSGNFSLLYPFLPQSLVPISVNAGSATASVTLPSDSRVHFKSKSAPKVEVSSQFDSLDSAETPGMHFDINYNAGAGKFELKKNQR